MEISQSNMHWKQASKPSHIIFVWTPVVNARMQLFSVQWLSWVKPKTFHLLWICPQMRRKWWNNKVFFYRQRMQILAKDDTHAATRVDLAAMFGLSVSTLNTKVNQKSEKEKSYSQCGPSFSKEPKSLKTLPMEELETILSAWFKQACTANASTDGAHLKKRLYM